MDSLTAAADAAVPVTTKDSSKAVSPAANATPEFSDSLLHAWYSELRFPEDERYRDIDMDAARFSSNVSDEEMMRRLSAMNPSASLSTRR